MVALLSSLAAFLTASTASSGCYSGLYVIVARGSTEPAGLGLTGSLANRVAKQVPNSKVVAVDYPATIDSPVYFKSEKIGAAAAKKLVLDYQSKCPSNKIALMGWSQGGQIMTDLLCGGEGDPNFNNQQALSSSIVKDNIVAVTVFGDPTFVPNKSWDVGTSKKSGVFPRTNLSQCSGYTDLLKSYCDEGDYFCASGESLDVHTGYFDKDGTQIVNFIVKRFEDSKGTNSSASQGASTPTSSLNGVTPTPISSGQSTPTKAATTSTAIGGGGGSSGSETTITSIVSLPATTTSGSGPSTTSNAPTSSSPGSAAGKINVSWGLFGGILALMGAMI